MSQQPQSKVCDIFANPRKPPYLCIVAPVHSEAPFFDIADYAHLLAKETGDDQLESISASLDQAFKDAFVHYRDVNTNTQQLNKTPEKGGGGKME